MEGTRDVVVRRGEAEMSGRHDKCHHGENEDAASEGDTCLSTDRLCLIC